MAATLDKNYRKPWYTKWRGGWPKKIVDKPYNDWAYDGRVMFMPRLISPMKAAMVKLRIANYMEKLHGEDLMATTLNGDNMDALCDMALRSLSPSATEPVAYMRPSEEGYDSAFRDASVVNTCTGGDWKGWIPLYVASSLPVEAEPTADKYVEWWSRHPEASHHIIVDQPGDGDVYLQFDDRQGREWGVQAKTLRACLDDAILRDAPV